MAPLIGGKFLGTGPVEVTFHRMSPERAAHLLFCVELLPGLSWSVSGPGREVGEFYQEWEHSRMSRSRKRGRAHRSSGRRSIEKVA